MSVIEDGTRTNQHRFSRHKGTALRPVNDRVLVSDMYFGEKKTSGGIILTDDDGQERGVYPRWGKVYAKGKSNKDEYQVDDWILIAHGRWTRGICLETENEDIVLRMVEAESILAYSDDPPHEAQVIGDGPRAVWEFDPRHGSEEARLVKNYDGAPPELMTGQSEPFSKE